MKETREILVNWIGDLDAFKTEFPKVQVVPIPEMVDGSYMIIYECYTEEVDGETIVHDFKDERRWLRNNGTLIIIGRWGKRGRKKPNSTTTDNHTKTKYRRYLRKVWSEELQRLVRPPANTPVNGISGWQNRDIE